MPGRLLKHERLQKDQVPDHLVADSVTIVAKDFVIGMYHNGKPVPVAKRKLLLDRFGATAERAELRVRKGDWLVFHVAANPVRHGGAKYFALGAAKGEDPFVLVSQLDSARWSSCDDPEQVEEFIRHRDYGTESRVQKIALPWKEGAKFVEQYVGEGFPGDAIWGKEAATWLKVLVPEEGVSLIDVLRASEDSKKEKK